MIALGSGRGEKGKGASGGDYTSMVFENKGQNDQAEFLKFADSTKLLVMSHVL